MFRFAVCFAALFLGSVTVALGRECVSSVAELRAVLDLPADEKSGRTVCIAPGDYRALGRSDYEGRFIGLDPAHPIVFEAEDPADPPVFSHWYMGGGGAPSGNVVLRGLEFRIEGGAEVPPGSRGFNGANIAIEYGRDQLTENFTVENVTIRGTLEEARRGGLETERYQFGINGRMGRNLVIRNNRFERIVHAIAVAGENILVERNIMRRGWGDLVQVVPQVMPDGGCAETRGVVVRDNVLGNMWSNGRIHPDLVQMYPSHNVECAIGDVLFEGNILFPGRDGMMQPAFPSWFDPAPPRPVPAEIESPSNVFHRFTGGGEVRLPPARCGEKREMVVIQRDPGVAPPIRVLAAPGDVMDIRRSEATEVELADDWETWRFMCRPGQSGRWQAQQLQNGPQGIFSNNLGGGSGYSDITVRHNVIWVSTPHGISFLDPDNRNIEVYRNSVLVPFPGDLNGDGVPNTDDDGLNTFFASGNILLHEDPSIRARGNIAANLRWTGMPEGEGGNDTGIDGRDGGRGMAERFRPTGPGPAFLPDTPTEAIEFARPRADGPLGGGGIGALGVTPDGDPHDFSWVTDDW